MQLQQRGRHAESSQHRWRLRKKKLLSTIKFICTSIYKATIGTFVYVRNNLSSSIAILICMIALLTYGDGVNFVAFLVSTIVQILGLPVLLQLLVLDYDGHIPYLLSKSHFLYAYIFTIQFLIGVYFIKYYPELYSDSKAIGLMTGYTQCLTSIVSLTILPSMNSIKIEWIDEWIRTMRIYPILWLCMIIIESTVSLLAGSFFDSPVMIYEHNIPESNKAWDIISSDLIIGVLLVEQMIEIGKHAIDILEYFMHKSKKYL